MDSPPERWWVHSLEELWKMLLSLCNATSGKNEFSWDNNALCKCTQRNFISKKSKNLLIYYKFQIPAILKRVKNKVNNSKGCKVQYLSFGVSEIGRLLSQSVT